MQERRQRILDAARHLIVAKGPDRFSMLDVSRQAGVSEKALYNIMGGRDNLILCIVQSYQQDLASGFTLPHAHDLSDILNSLSTICDRLVAEEGWGKAITALYFSAARDDATFGLLQSVAQTHLDRALDLFARNRQVRKHSPVAFVRQQFVSTAYSLLYDWSLGRIAGPDFSRQIGFALVAALLVLVTQAGRPRLTDLIDQMVAGGNSAQDQEGVKAVCDAPSRPA